MAEVAVLGAGRVGLPWALFLAESGHDVSVYDINPETVRAINERRNPGVEPGVQEALLCLDITATTELDTALNGSEAAFIYVPTPELPHGKGLDGSIVAVAFKEICDWTKWLEWSRPYPVVVCSTVMPGTMAELWRECETKDAVDLFYCPPLIALGSALNDHRKAEIQFFGHGEDGPTMEWLLAFYAQFWGRRIRVMSWMQAEVGKLMNNIMIAQRVHFAHRVAGVCDVVGIDPRPILDAIAGDPRFGSAFLKAGPPPDGDCIPRDVRAIQAWLESQGAGFPDLYSTEDWHDEELLAVIDLAQEAGGDVLIVGSSYKTLYFDNPAVYAFSNDMAEALTKMGHTVRCIPALRTLDDAPEFTEQFKLICLMEQGAALSAKWVRDLCKRESHHVYDPWLQVHR